MPDSDDDERRKEAQRARKQQREASGRARKSNDEGRHFHYGVAEKRGEIRKQGWQHEVSVKLPSGRERIHDAGRSTDHYEFREYKEGRRVGGKFVMEQISKEFELMRADAKARGSGLRG